MGFRNISNMNNNEAAEQIGDLSHHSLEDLTRMVRGWQQELNQVFATLPTFNSNEPVTAAPSPVVQQTVIRQASHSKKSHTKSNEAERGGGRRKTINKPTRLKHMDGSTIQDHELVSIVDGTLLTKAEINTLKPGPKIHQVFSRDGQQIEAVSHQLWWSEYVWVHPVPVNGSVVYVDPQEYKNMKKADPQVLNGMIWNSLFTYGEPPVYAVRYGTYRKKYDLYNRPKVDEEIQTNNANQHRMQITQNPLYQEEAPAAKRMKPSTSGNDNYLTEPVEMAMPNNYASHPSILFTSSDTPTELDIDKEPELQSVNLFFNRNGNGF